MIIGKVVCPILEGDASVAALAGDRIYPYGATAENPQMPYVTYELYGGESMSALDGPAGVATPKVEIVAWSKCDDYDVIEALSEAIRLALQNRARQDLGLLNATVIEFGDYKPDEDSQEAGRFYRFELMLIQPDSN